MIKVVVYNGTRKCSQIAAVTKPKRKPPMPRLEPGCAEPAFAIDDPHTLGIATHLIEMVRAAGLPKCRSVPRECADAESIRTLWPCNDDTQ